MACDSSPLGVFPRHPARLLPTAAPLEALRFKATGRVKERWPKLRETLEHSAHDYLWGKTFEEVCSTSFKHHPHLPNTCMGGILSILLLLTRTLLTEIRPRGPCEEPGFTHQASVRWAARCCRSTWMPGATEMPCKPIDVFLNETIWNPPPASGGVLNPRVRPRKGQHMRTESSPGESWCHLHTHRPPDWGSVSFHLLCRS